MPELPEVETTRRGITPHIQDRRITGVVVRQARLRWPVPRQLGQKTTGQKIRSVLRRGKYLLLQLDAGTVILHLGMSGSLRLVPWDTPADKHDHVDIQLDNKRSLRLHDPRRFGAVLWTSREISQHKLFKHLGPEPLTDDFTGAYLHALSRKRKCNIKSLIMNAGIVVGVGNIYACEALFLAGIRPGLAVDKLSRPRCEKLVAGIKAVLQQAIAAGGTTLRDFTDGDGKPGYFKQQLQVYDREGQDCHRCGQTIKRVTSANRSTYYCPHCQK